MLIAVSGVQLPKKVTAKYILRLIVFQTSIQPSKTPKLRKIQDGSLESFSETDLMIFSSQIQNITGLNFDLIAVAMAAVHATLLPHHFF